MNELIKCIDSQDLNKIDSILSRNSIMLWNYYIMGDDCATPLGYAIHVNAENVVKYLLGAWKSSGGRSHLGDSVGVKINGQCWQNDRENIRMYPLALARKRGFSNIEKLLLEHGAF